MKLATYQKIIFWGLSLALLSFLVYSHSFYFPYITIKQIYFNIVVELTLGFWLAMICQYPDTRPKNNWLNWSLLIWLLILGCSAILGLDFNLSFWGDAERMLGIFSLLHFVGFYLMAASLRHDRPVWRQMLAAVIGLATIIALYTLLKQVDIKNLGNVNLDSNIGTLGNATYVACLMIFGLFLAALSWLWTKSHWQKWLYGLAMIIMLGGFLRADVSGAQAGLLLGVLLTATVIGFGHRQVKVRRLGLGLLIFLVLATTSLFVCRGQAVFDNNKFGTVLRDFSWHNTNLNTRTYAWRAAILAWEKQPLWGWGYGNFQIVFDRYFTADYYHWTTTEEYFDRAHNMLLEFLATSGSLGLLAYLGIWGAAIYTVILGWQRQILRRTEVAILGGLLLAYFIYNLAAFDDLSSSVDFMLVLALVQSSVHGSPAAESQPQVWTPSRLGLLGVTEFICLILIGQNLIFAQRFKNIIPLLTLSAQSSVASYQQFFAGHFPLDRDLRSLLIDKITDDPANLAVLNGWSADDRQAFWSLLLDLAQRNLQYDQADSLAHWRAAKLLAAASVSLQDSDDLNQALTEIDLAIAAGPQHIPPYYTKANIFLLAGRRDLAEKVLQTAHLLAPDYWQTDCYLEKLAGTTVDARCP